MHVFSIGSWVTFGFGMRRGRLHSTTRCSVSLRGLLPGRSRTRTTGRCVS